MSTTGGRQVAGGVPRRSVPLISATQRHPGNTSVLTFTYSHAHAHAHAHAHSHAHSHPRAGAAFFGVKDVVKAALRDGSLGGVVLSKEAATVAAVFVAQFPYWALRNPSEVWPSVTNRHPAARCPPTVQSPRSPLNTLNTLNTPVTPMNRIGPPNRPPTHPR